MSSHHTIAVNPLFNFDSDGVQLNRGDTVSFSNLMSFGSVTFDVPSGLFVSGAESFSLGFGRVSNTFTVREDSSVLGDHSFVVTLHGTAPPNWKGGSGGSTTKSGNIRVND